MLEISGGFILGIIFGLLFWSGLFWTVNRVKQCRNPGLLIVLSFVIRSFVLLGGFWWISMLGISGILACSIGVLFVKVVFLRFQKFTEKKKALQHARS